MIRLNLFAGALAFGIFTTVTSAGLASSASGATKIIAIDGEAAPGGGRFEFFGEPVINNQGQVAFTAELDDIAAGSPVGAFRFDGSQTIRIAGPSQQPSSGSIAYVSSTAINSLGEVTVAASTFGTSTGPNLLLRGSGGPLTTIAQVGQTIRGGQLAQLPIHAHINDSGHVAFAVSFDTASGVTSGVYRGNGGPLTEIARVGGPSPGGGSYMSFYWGFPINNLGQVAFTATTNGPSPSGIFRGTGTETVKIAMEGDPTPAGDGLFTDLQFKTAALNNSGQVAFIGSAKETATEKHYGAVYRGSGGPLTELVRQGQPTPGGEEVFLAFFYGPMINDHGQTVFAAFLEDPSSPDDPFISIYRADGRTLAEAMRAGSLSPDGNGRFIDFGNPELNNHGQIAVMAQLTDTEQGTLDDRGLYFYSDKTGLVQVVREGQAMLGSTIVGLQFTGGLSHVQSIDNDSIGLNDLGQVAFQFRLADGRNGVAIWQIPEPASGAIALTALTTCGCRRGYKRVRAGRRLCRA